MQQNPDGKEAELGLGEELWETSSSPGGSKISFVKDKRNEAEKSLTRTDLTEVWNWVKINWIKSEHEYKEIGNCYRGVCLIQGLGHRCAADQKRSCLEKKYERPIKYFRGKVWNNHIEPSGNGFKSLNKMNLHKNMRNNVLWFHGLI